MSTDKKEVGFKLNLDMSLVNQGAENLGKGALQSFQTNFKKAWDSLSDEERKQAAKLLLEIGRLRLLEIAGSPVTEASEILMGALAQWKAVASGDGAAAFKSIASDIVGLGAQFVSTVLRGALHI